MEKINIAELLKDCPSGMELDCMLWDNVTFERVAHNGIWINYLNDKNYKYEIYLDNEGCLPVSFLNLTTSKCVIFPKGKTTWEGFHRPFRDGDIVFYDNCVSIFKEWGDETLFRNHVKVDIDGRHPMLCDRTHSNGKGIKREARFATEEEKAKLFQAIQNKGYKWNFKTKTLEELSKFKDGDVVVDDSGAIFIYKQIHPLYREPYADFYCGLTSESRRFKIKTGEVQRCGEISSVRYATEGEKQMLFNAIKANGYHWNAEKKTLTKLFKVGDRIRHKKNNTIIKTIGHIYDDGYALYGGHSLFFREQDEWELVPNKFDINTLVPFESKVLVRSGDSLSEWKPAIFGMYRNKYNNFYVVDGTCWKYCIPYKGNEHLLGTTNDCDDFYKTWE